MNRLRKASRGKTPTHSVSSLVLLSQPIHATSSTSHTTFTQHMSLKVCICCLVVVASLLLAGGGIVAEGRLLDLIRRLYCFGISLLKMDVRQESSRHTEAIDSITRLVACTASVGAWHAKTSCVVKHVSASLVVLDSDSVIRACLVIDPHHHIICRSLSVAVEHHLLCLLLLVSLRHHISSQHARLLFSTAESKLNHISNYIISWGSRRSSRNTLELSNVAICC